MQENHPFKRKFSSSSHTESHLAILETFYYHFIEQKNFFEKLRTSLMMEGVIAPEQNLRELRLKNIFKESETYKRGFVLLNRREERSKNLSDDEIQEAFYRPLEIRNYQMITRVLSDAQKNREIDSKNVDMLSLTEKYGFNIWLVKWALYYYQNKFFRFENLKKHIRELRSIDHFIEEFLEKYEIQYYFSNKKISDCLARERVNVLLYGILPEVEKAINTAIPKMIGSQEFYPHSINHIFEAQKTIYVGEGNERAYGQITHKNPELQLDLSQEDWYSHNENYGTTDEKKFVKFIASKIGRLKEKYKNSEIFLVRNELDFSIYSFENGERFSPDFVLFINDFDSKTLFYQCLFEVK